MELAEQIAEYVKDTEHLSPRGVAKVVLTTGCFSLYNDRSQPLCDVRAVSSYRGPDRFRLARPVRSHLGYLRVEEEALGPNLTDLRRPNGSSQPESSGYVWEY